MAVVSWRMVGSPDTDLQNEPQLTPCSICPLEDNSTLDTDPGHREDVRLQGPSKGSPP